VRPNAVYRNRQLGYAVIVCGVSRPVPTSSIKYERVILDCELLLRDSSMNTLKFKTHQIEPFVDGKYIHSRKDFSSTIVIYKSTLIRTIGWCRDSENEIGDLQTDFETATLSKFLDNYELVIGYESNHRMITESMFDIPSVK
jgi:hypothetical protein